MKTIAVVQSFRLFARIFSTLQTPTIQYCHWSLWQPIEKLYTCEGETVHLYRGNCTLLSEKLYTCVGETCIKENVHLYRGSRGEGWVATDREKKYFFLNILQLKPKGKKNAYNTTPMFELIFKGNPRRLKNNAKPIHKGCACHKYNEYFWNKSQSRTLPLPVPPPTPHSLLSTPFPPPTLNSSQYLYCNLSPALA